VSSWARRTGLRSEPVEELVAQEPELAAAGEPVTRDLAFTHQLPEVLDMDLQQLRGHRRREHGREVSRCRRHLLHDNGVCRIAAPTGRGRR